MRRLSLRRVVADIRAGRLNASAKPNFVLYEGLVLPPPGIPRHGGKDDAGYVHHAKENVRLARELAGLTVEDRVLDIGCGAGRFLTGMLATFGRVNEYTGIDVRRKVIVWCDAALTNPAWGRIRFEWVNVENPRYNNAQKPTRGVELRLPVADASIDLTVLFSVFSHMRFDDTASYLKEIARVLDRGGRCYCTAFVEDGVETWAENPRGYLRAWKGPLHCARFNRNAFEGLIADAGLTISHFARRPSKLQSVYVLVRD
jgi:SAM-dependent methyltransferase